MIERERDENDDRLYYTGRVWHYRAFIRDYDGSIREINVVKEPVSQATRMKVTGNHNTPVGTRIPVTPRDER